MMNRWSYPSSCRRRSKTPVAPATLVPITTGEGLTKPNPGSNDSSRIGGVVAGAKTRPPQKLAWLFRLGRFDEAERNGELAAVFFGYELAIERFGVVLRGGFPQDRCGDTA